MDAPHIPDTLLYHIATPFSTGAGFYLAQYGLLVSSAQLLADSAVAVAKSPGQPRCLAQVVYVDERHDVALLRPESPLAGEPLPLAEALPEAGQAVFAYAYAQGRRVERATGHLSAPVPEHLYWPHDAHLPAACMGGPVLDAAGRLLGMNRPFGGQPAHSELLPLAYILAGCALLAGPPAVREGLRCGHCEALWRDVDLGKKQRCPACHARVALPSAAPGYEAEGTARTVESMLAELGQDVRLARIGPDQWQIEQGSATIDLRYYEPTGLITGDAYLCVLPTAEAAQTALYAFLLQQNHAGENLSFSVRGRYVVLSLIIHDRYLMPDTGLQLLRSFFEKADYYDNILVEQYGATWRYPAS